MSFVRAKTVKGKKYAYLVENVWNKGKVKQQVKKYLGRIFILPEFNSSFTNFNYINFDHSLRECMQNIVANALLPYGFSQKGKQLFFDSLCVNLSRFKIKTSEGKNAVLFLNNRYLYGGQLRSIIDFFAPEAEDDIKGKRLAEVFSDAGITIQTDDFIQLYKKIYLSKNKILKSNKIKKNKN